MKNARGQDGKEKVNPFERRVVKPKFNILGRKLKGTESQTGQARDAAIELRKRTLLQEYNRKGRENVFKDQRFGEKDANLDQEEKMLRRFQKERLARFQKSNIYNLDEDTEELTHLGTSLSAIDDFNEEILGSSDEEEGAIDASTVEQLHFGGFVPKQTEEVNDGKPKTKKEIMQELIAKSKFYKAERQREKQEGEELMTKLDEEWNKLLQEGKLAPLQKSSEVESGKAKDAKDDYNQLYRELASELRARATDRLKTPEELALEEKEKLERLEAERLRRMHGEEEQEGDEDAAQISADSLDGNYVLDPEFGAASSDEEENAPNDHQPKPIARKAEQPPLPKMNMEQAADGHPTAPRQSELPYTFSVPDDYQGFHLLVNHRPPEELDVVIYRTRVCHDPRLAPENKPRMEHFYGILFEHFGTIARQKPVQMKALNVLTKHLFQLAQSMPETAAKLARTCLSQMEQSLSQRLERFSVQEMGRVWPTVEEQLYLKLLSIIFPVTDYQHTVTTPALLFMAQCLAQCPLSSPIHATSGLFLCNMIYHYVHGSCRFVPEIFYFLNSILSLALVCNSAKRNSSRLRKQFEEIPLIDLSATFLKITAIEEVSNTPRLDYPKVMQLKAQDPYFGSNAFRTATLSITLRLLMQFSTLYFQNTEVMSYVEIFSPIYVNLTRLAKLKQLGRAILATVRELKQKLANSMKRKLENRVPLQQRRKPVPLRMLNPQFHDRYQVGKDYDSNKERAETKKLQRKYKREMKGAVREIRKDNLFLQEESLRKRNREALEREQKTKEILAFLSDQQGELNKLKYMNKKIKQNEASVL
jgi:nucleolar protein 14